MISSYFKNITKSRFLPFIIVFIVYITNFSINVTDVNAAIIMNKSERKYNMIFCTLVKNENRFMPEWIEFHLIQGNFLWSIIILLRN